MDVPVSPMSTVMMKTEDAQLRAWFEPCCLCFAEHQAQSMVREVVKDELVAQRIFERMLPKMDYQEVGDFVSEEMSNSDFDQVGRSQAKLAILPPSVFSSQKMGPRPLVIFLNRQPHSQKLSPPLPVRPLVRAASNKC